MIHNYGLFEKFKINYSGLAELIVNAIANIPPFLNLDELPE